MMNTTLARLAGVGLLALVLAACSGAGASVRPSQSPSPSGPGVTTAPPDGSATNAVVATLPGVGADYMAKIPADTGQVVLAVGDGMDEPTGHVSFWQRADGGWQKVSDDIPTHNGTKGWAIKHERKDLRTPIGVYTLTNAGGLLPNPGTKLPYETKDWYYGDVNHKPPWMGHSLAGAFDYVVAIDYNRVPGTPPSSKVYPMGIERGGGIWFHVDHVSPTHGCISLPREEMKALLLWLDPAQHPITIMGPAATLAR